MSTDERLKRIHIAVFFIWIQTLVIAICAVGTVLGG